MEAKKKTHRNAIAVPHRHSLIDFTTNGHGKQGAQTTKHTQTHITKSKYTHIFLCVVVVVVGTVDIARIIRQPHTECDLCVCP